MRVNNNLLSLRLAAGLFATLCLAGPMAAYDLIAPVSLWPVGDVSWEVKLVGNGTNIPNPSVGSPLQDGSTSWGEALQKVIDDWNTVIPDDVLTLSIVPNSAIDPGSNDGVNNVGFSPTIYGDAWSGSVVGISLSIWTGNRKVENDVLFNATKTWDSYEGPQQAMVTDFRRIALHEFGHSLGLDHPDQAGQVVTAIMNSASSNVYELQQDDIDGILSIYGAVIPVAITSHPKSYTAPVGGTWPLSVAATGSELISYDWELSTNGGTTWAPVPGIDDTVSTWSYPGVNNSQNGWRIRVSVTNPAGSVVSNVAILTVTATPQAPAITAQPGNASAAVGENASFTVDASGSPTPTIQWEYSSNGGGSWLNVVNGFVLPSGPSYSGATTTTLTVSGTIAGVNGRLYRAVATNGSGSATSTSASLTVTGVAVAPSITSHPSNQTVAEGDPVSFTVSATGTAPLSYQWKKGGADIGGATSATYSIVSASEAHEGSYTVVVSNAQGSVTSNAATLTVNQTLSAPVITSHPANLALVAGASASFTVSATGTAPLSYQWRKGGVDIGGATSATYTIPSVVTGSAGTYSVVVSNLQGSATSNGATLTVTTPPAILSQPTSRTAVIGSDVTFSVTASGTNPLTYQWKRNGVNVSGGTGATLALANVQAGDAGTYTCVVTNAAGSATSNPATLTLDSTARLINVSCLASAGAGDSTLVIGFYINGPPGGVKTLLIRGIGPRLSEPDFNVPNTVPDPSIAVYNDDNDLVAFNDDWNSSLAPDFARVGAFALTNGSKDAAFKVSLTPGLYTVHLVNAAPLARGLIEVYDFSRDSSTRLTNVSCRIDMSPGEVVILGTALIANSSPMLARAVGPELANYGIPQADVLPDPKLTAYSGNTVIGSNDDWETATGAYFGPVGAFPLTVGSKDAAVRVTATPGGFTIHASSTGSGGIGLIEIYESP